MTAFGWSVVAALLSSQVLGAEVLSGRVVAVTDGDTIGVITPTRQSRIVRLAGIDAPEKSQPYGRRAKQYLSDAVFGKEVSLDCSKIDRYGRDVCVVWIDGRDVNFAQIKSGMAWWYRKYSSEQCIQSRSAYEAAEVEARSERSGLWEESSPVPPWEWRRSKRLGSGPKRRQLPSSAE